MSALICSMRLTWIDLLRRQRGRKPSAIEHGGKCPKAGWTNQLTTVAAQFQSIDPAIVNETISASLIGRNMEGFWVARDQNGLIGGIFLLERSALSPSPADQRVGPMCNQIFSKG
jgi:hypothetical protein